MAQEIYRDRISLLIDLKLYIALRNSQPANLAMFPRLTLDRWPWMVANWASSLHAQFNILANGDEYLLDILRRLDNHAFSWKGGSGVNPFSDMELFSDSWEFLETITLASIQPTDFETKFAAREFKRLEGFQDVNFLAMLDFLITQRDIAFDFIGLNDPTYDAFKHRATSPKQRDFFVNDLVQLNDALDLEQFIEGIIFEIKSKTQSEPNLLAFANAKLAAGQNQVTVADIYASYYSVPFEQSLEQMAQDYLGNKDKWYELVTVNRLKPPYVDLFGLKLQLMENASGNILKVSSGQKEKYLVGSSVKIGSRLIPEEVRIVEAVVDNQDGSASVRLSGKQDLSRLETRHIAFMRAFTPETLRDFSFVKIPSAAVSPYRAYTTPTRGVLKNLDKVLFAFGVDIGRDEFTGDLLIDGNGDLKLQFGLANVRQAVQSILTTAVRELPLHAEYGIPEFAGVLNPGVDLAIQIAAIIEKAVKRDTRFSSVKVENIVISPEGKMSMSVNVSLAGLDQLIPLAFVV